MLRAELQRPTQTGGPQRGPGLSARPPLPPRSLWPALSAPPCPARQPIRAQNAPTSEAGAGPGCPRKSARELGLWERPRRLTAANCVTSPLPLCCGFLGGIRSSPGGSAWLSLPGLSFHAVLLPSPHLPCAASPFPRGRAGKTGELKIWLNPAEGYCSFGILF